MTKNNMSKDTKEKLITVLYDGECPYCHHEIKWYQFLDKRKKISWVDITKNKDYLNKENIKYDDAESELHVIDSNGQRHIGVSGFFQIWEKLPGYSVLARLLSHSPRMVRWMNTWYKKFTVWRLNRKLKQSNV